MLDIETDVGPMFVHAEDRVMTPWMSERGDWEPAEARWLRSVIRPGHTVLDVGANVGYFSLLAAGLVGEAGAVISVEPERRNLALLRANLWRNRRPQVTVLPIAASARTGFLPLTLNELNRGDHQVGRADSAAETLVPSAALDDLLTHQTIDVIKVDTQGHDHEVIWGMGETIARTHPVIMCEFWLDGMGDRNVSADDVARIYEGSFRLQLLDEDGIGRDVDASGLVSGAREAPGRFVNAVLRPLAAA